MRISHEQAEYTGMAFVHLGRDSRYSYDHRQLHLSWGAFGMVKDDNGDVWLTPKEAAVKLNLSVGRIYQIKNSLTHRKVGDANQGRLFFLESALFDDYMNM